MNDEKIVKAMARERIERLIGLAKRPPTRSADKYSTRYVRLAREISTHYKVGMTKEERNSFCRKCSRILVPGRTCTVILSSREKCAIYRCACGTEKRIFYG